MAAAKRLSKSAANKSRSGRRPLLGSRIGLEPLEERAMLAVFHVSLGGSDGNDGSVANPYRTIQAAITAASLADDGDDIINVEGGNYNVAGVDLGFSINSDAELDTLDIVGGWDPTFTTRDLINTPTNYTPQDAGGQILVGDDDVTIDGINFVFDGTNAGVLLAANNTRLDSVDISGATEGVVGDSLTGTVSIEDSYIHDNSGSGVQLTNQTGDLIVNGTIVSSNGNHGIDFEGSNAFVSIQVSGLTLNSNGVGARIVNTGGQVAFGNNSSVTLNGAGISVSQASSLAIDATVVDANTLSGLTTNNVDQIDLTGASSFSSNLFSGVSITNAGSLTTNNINVNSNSAGGLIASNVSGDVSITASNFGANSTGIAIDGAASVTIAGSTANGNTVANGLFVSGISGKVDVDGGTFSSNAAIGIEIRNSNEVEVSNMAIDSNGDGAMLIDNTTTSVVVSLVTATLNVGGGFEITGADSVTITAIVHANSGFEALRVENVTGLVDIVAGAYHSNTNGADGVVVDQVGALNMTNVVVQSNAGDGIHASNVTGAVDIAGGGSSVNGGAGMLFEMVGSVILTNTAANLNSVGLVVEGADSVDDFGGTYSANTGGGILISSIGAGGVILNTTAANENGGDGLFAVDITGTITLTSVNFDLNDLDGAHIESAGPVIANGITVGNNGDDGMHFEDVASLSVTTATASTNASGAGLRALDVTGAVEIQGTFDTNNAGIIVNNAASVAIEQTNAISNNLNGITISNITGLVEISLTSATGNSFHGISVTTVDALTIDSVSVNNNSAAGLLANGVTGDVSITNAAFDENSSGIGIDGASRVIVDSISASNNTTGSGLFVNNVTFLGTAVSITNATFGGNAADGVRVTNVTAEVIIDFVEASGNVEQGIDIAGAEELELNNLVLKNNASGIGGQIDGVDQIRFNGTTAGVVADLIVVTGTSITHTRAGDAQQTITYTGDTFRLGVGGHGGDDTIQINGAFTLGAGDGLLVLGGSGNDLLEANGVSGFGQTVPLTFNGESGDDTFTVSTGSGFDDLVKLESQFVTVQRGPNAQAATPEVHEYVDVEVITIATAGGNDSVVVTEPAVSGQFPGIVNINGGDENDGIEINLGNPTTDTIYNIDGGAGSNGVTVFTRSASDNVLTFATGQVLVELRTLPNLGTLKTINHTNIRGINAYADAGNDSFVVTTSNLGASLQRLSLFGQGDNDISTVNLSDPALASLIQYDGGAGIDNRLIVNTNSADADVVSVDSELIRAQLGANPAKDVQYTGVQVLRVLTGGGNDTISVSQGLGAPALPASTEILSEGGADNVMVAVANIPSTVGISINSGSDNDTLTVLLGPVSMQTTLYVSGDTGGDDRVQVVGDPTADNVISVGDLDSNTDRIRINTVEQLFMIGGAGVNDFTNNAIGALQLVFMLGGAGNDVFTNNSSANSILDGLGGNDSLTGGTGRDMLLGEGGLDTLTAVSEEDLLISGPVSFDLHVESLLSIMSEWTSGRTFEERVANINGTGIGARNNGDNFLQVGVTVFDEGALDMLSGGTQADWFFAQTSNDQILDEQALEDIVTNIP